MELILHLGAHGTDDGQLAGWMDANSAALRATGTVAVPPRLFLGALSQALASRPERPASHDEEQALLLRLGADAAQGIDRLVVSAPGFLGATSTVFTPEGFYRRDVLRRVYALRLLFPTVKLGFLLAVRDPAGLVPTLMAQPDAPAPEAIAAALEEETLPWAALIRRLRHQAPAAEVTVWQHEALSTVWPGILAAIAGPGRAVPLAGIMGLAGQGLSAEARLRAERYLQSNPPADPGQVQRVAAAFATRFGRAPQPLPGAELPGWMVSRLAEQQQGYRTEWEDLANLPGVRVLA